MSGAMALRCTSVGPNLAELTVVFLHGFGAPGDDLVPLAGEMVAREPRLGGARFVFPEGLLALPEAGPRSRAWWNIDLPRWQALQLRDEAMLEQMRNEAPPGLAEARSAVLDLVAALRRGAPPVARLVLGGFSQGAMLAADVGLRVAPAPDALLLFSGSVVNAPEWRKLAPARRGLPVFQSHGRQDPILPYEGAEQLRDLLREGGLEVEFLPFSGGHGIHPAALARAMALLARVAALPAA